MTPARMADPDARGAFVVAEAITKSRVYVNDANAAYARGFEVLNLRAGGMLHEFTVTVLEIRGGKVKLGFNADPSISVQRSEVLARLRTGELPDGHTDDLRGMTAR